MGTLLEDIDLLKGNKANIKQAIKNKGQIVEDTDPLSSYPNKIIAIDSRHSQEKEATITIDDSTELTKEIILIPDSTNVNDNNNTISKATITAQAVTGEKAVIITSAGNTEIVPDNGTCGMSKITIAPKLEERTAAMSTLNNVVVTTNSGNAGMSKVTVTPPTVQGTRTYAIPANANNSSYDITTNQSGAVGMQKVSISGAYGSTTVTNYGNTRYTAGYNAGVTAARSALTAGTLNAIEEGNNKSITVTIPDDRAYSIVVGIIVFAGSNTMTATSKNCNIAVSQSKWGLGGGTALGVTCWKVTKTANNQSVIVSAGNGSISRFMAFGIY